MMQCPMCRGRGSCPECDGLGEVTCSDCDGQGCEGCLQTGAKVCLPCDGSGKCPRCKGAGELQARAYPSLRYEL